jgi:hypothetical protein
MDPNPLPRKRRDPGPGWWAAVTPDGEGHRPAQQGFKGCADGLCSGARELGWRRDSRAALPDLPAGTAGLSPAIKWAPRPGYCSLPLCDIGAAFFRRRRRRLRP